MKQIVIRRAVPGDVDALSALFVELDEHHFRRAPEEFLQLDGPARSREAIAEIVGSEAGVVLVAYEEHTGRVVGFTHVFKREFSPTVVAPARCVAEVDTLMVASDDRQRGVGTLLVLGAERWAADQQLTVLELGVREFNSSALAFYEATGFQTTARRMRRPVAPPDGTD